MLCFTDSPLMAKPASATSSSRSDSDSSGSSIYQEEEYYHSIESEELVDYITRNIDYITRDPTYRTHVCMVGSLNSKTERQTIGVT